MPDRGGSQQPRGPRLRTGLPGRGRGLLLRGCFVVLVLLALAFAGSAVRADQDWYRSVGYGGVWSSVLRTRVFLFLAFGLPTALLVGLNAWLAYRLRSPLSAMSEEQQSLERYRAAIGRHRGRILAVVALVPGLVAGAAASGAWQTWLAYDHSTRFGTVDPQFHRDLSFYVFQLPWYRFLVDFGFTVLVVTLAGTALVHYLYGSIQAQARGRRFSCAAKGHLGLLLGLFVGLKAVAYWLDRYSLAVQGGSLGAADNWTGLRFTDAAAVLPAKTILCCVAVICALLFLLTPLRRSWTVPMIGLGLMAFSSVLIGAVYPAIVQQFQVRPNEKAKERPYIQRNITATRAAFGIAGTRTTDYPAPRTAAGEAPRTDAGDAVAAGATALAGLSLPAPAVAVRTTAASAAKQRVEAVAPWLTVDGDPYRVSVDGRSEWVVDGYTTSDDYPGAARTTMGSGADAGQLNYVRDSVKATVDGSTGAVALYQWDRTDPVLSTWMKAFPGTVRPYAAISPELKARLRYPKDLFTVQQRMLATYHVTDPAAFYRGSDVWRIPADPTGTGTGPQAPAYLSLRMPDQSSATLALTGSFVLDGRNGLAALMAVDSTPGADYGTIRVLDLPSGSTTPGPAQVQAAFGSDPVVAPQLALLRETGGAAPVYGSLLALPVDGGVLYLEPVYARGAVGAHPLPEKVLALFGGKPAIASDLPTVLSEVLGTPGGGALATSLQQAQQAYRDGQAALGSGDSAGYEADRQRLEAALRAALAAGSAR
ncbi:UPF0182 family protein [Streptacidiphilus sp. N1-12]|uniref:UPF0182 family protein n=2 Tax=Streptacidiphilus alkalitolerans TaxID=3342712 RepID=A0ABV6WJG3_9ACTN